MWFSGFQDVVLMWAVVGDSYVDPIIRVLSLLTVKGDIVTCSRALAQCYLSVCVCVSL